MTKEKKRDRIIQTALGLFSKNGFYSTTIPQIAQDMHMSVGNMYNYFSSKDVLAKEVIKYISGYIASRIKDINESKMSTREKTQAIVAMYFSLASRKPEMIDYFLRVYLSNREVFKDGCEGMTCVSEFVTEIMIFFEGGVEAGDLRNQDFFSAFGLFMGYLGGMVFLNGEHILPRDLDSYVDDIAENIYNALKA
ncbi:MAG: TetR/AcrR family transcriptional regulator [Campylobacterota bacterium]